MTVAVPTTIVKGFATDPTARNTIPVTASATPGAASYNVGFPPETRIPKNMGGVPPFGKDANGILFDISSNIAWLQGGGGYTYSATFSTANGGYGLGAVLKSATDPTRWYYNRSAGNTNDPDVNNAGWTTFSLIAAPTESQDIVLTAGNNNNVVMAEGVGLLNFDTTAGAAAVTGLVPAFDGQIVVVRNATANLLTLPKDSASSSAANRWRLPADLALIQGQTKAFKNFAVLPGWVAL